MTLLLIFNIDSLLLSWASDISSNSMYSNIVGFQVDFLVTFWRGRWSPITGYIDYLLTILNLCKHLTFSAAVIFSHNEKIVLRLPSATPCISCIYFRYTYKCQEVFAALVAEIWSRLVLHYGDVLIVELIALVLGCILLKNFCFSLNIFSEAFYFCSMFSTGAVLVYLTICILIWPTLLLGSNEFIPPSAFQCNIYYYLQIVFYWYSGTDVTPCPFFLPHFYSWMHPANIFM